MASDRAAQPRTGKPPGMRPLVAACALLAGCPGVFAADAPIPIQAFARIPAIARPALSPDGKRVVVISGVQDVRVALVLELGTGKPQPIVTSLLNKFDLTWCDWASDTRILCGLRGFDSDLGHPFPVTRLVGVNADGTQQKVLVQNSRARLSQYQDEILDWTPDDPEHVLVTASEDGDPFPEVYALNVNNGSLRKRNDEREPVTDYYTDGRGEVRLARGYRNNTVSWMARLAGDRDWRTITRYQYFKSHSFTPVGFGDSPNQIYVDAELEGRDALWLLDLEDRSDPQLVFSHALVDIDAPIKDEAGRMIGVRYETDMPFAFYTDPKADAIIRGVRAALPDQFSFIADQSRDGRFALIGATSDVKSLTYYRYDADSNQLQRIGTAYPELDKLRLAQMRSISYPARDGTRIPGYLTTPVGTAPKNLPLVVLPHGGPIARDSWGFDFLVQFLASRGYAVLQMNFRGSSGYGSDWYRAAHQDWGGLTYDDIADGARWAIESGTADPKRMCIVGWSFGGYAALLGAVRNADLFRCSASIAGVSDLKQLLAESRMYYGHQTVREQLGRDTDKLERDSPRRHAGDVEIPVLMLHGDRDAQVNRAHSQIMAKELKKAGKAHEYVFLENASHQIDDIESRTILLQKLEQFLARNLGAGAAPAAATQP